MKSIIRNIVYAFIYVFGGIYVAIKTLVLRGIFYGTLFLVGWLLIVKFLPVTHTVDIKAISHDPHSYVLILYAQAILAIADEDDTVILRIYSPGGSVLICADIINSIKDSLAHTISYNEGIAYSAGAVIAMSTDEVKSAYMSEYLFHRPRIMIMGMPVLISDELPTVLMLKEMIHNDVFQYLTLIEQYRYQALMDDVIVTGRQIRERTAKGGFTDAERYQQYVELVKYSNDNPPKTIQQKLDETRSKSKKNK